MREPFANELERVREQSEGWARRRNLADLAHPDPEELDAFRDAWFGLGDEVRYRMATALAKAAEDDPSLDYTPLFSVLLEDEAPEVRAIGVANSVDAMDEAAAIRVLDLLRNDSAAEVRAEAAAALGLFVGTMEGDEISDSVRRDIDDGLLETINTPEEDVIVRQRAIEAFAYSDDPYVDGVLEDAYDSDDDELRASAVFGMGRRGEESWLPTIHRELRNEVEAIRMAAIYATAEIASPTSIPYLLQVIGEDPQLDVRVAAIYALADFETPEAGRILEDLLESDDVSLVNAADEAIEMRGSNFGEGPLVMFDYGLPDDEEFSEDGASGESDGYDE
jgi:HEAT repeat protein